MRKKEALLQSLKDGDEARAARLMSRVGILDRDIAAKCLTAALTNCSAELLAALLGHVPRGEYADTWSTEKPPPPPAAWWHKDSAEITGTLPTLAAAMGKPEHLRLLLDWGCDVNSASLDASTALVNHGHVRRQDRGGIFFRGSPQVCYGSKVRWFPALTPSLQGLTPLAAGIAFGNPSCVQLLLEREGVWLTEAPVVSETLVLEGWRWDTEAHRECRRLVRTRPDGSLRPLTLWAAIRRMSAAALRDELSRCAYDREEVIRAALVLTPTCDFVRKEQDHWKLLSLLGKRYSDALRDERVRRHLTALAYQSFDGKGKPLPRVVEQALGDTVDLDESLAGMDIYSAPLTELRLRHLGENRRLVMSRDVVGTLPGLSLTASHLRVLLRYVEFRAPSLPIGVSGLTAAILQSGDVRLLRQALNRGLIPAEEPIEALLELVGKNAAARSLLLTRQRPSLGLAPTGAERDSYRVLSEDEEKRVLADPDLRAMASEELLTDLLFGCHLHDPLYELPQIEDDLSEDGFEAHNYAGLFALRGETDVALRFISWICGREDRSSAVLVDRGDMPDSRMDLTMLCCAAAGGQTETVRALLDAGLDPEERDMGQPSAIYRLDDVIDDVSNDEEILSLSPLLCALLWERWDTAALLLERGARCDLSSYTVRRAFEEARGGDVPYNAIRRELGAHLEGSQLI